MLFRSNFSDFIHPQDFVSFDGSDFRQVVGVGQPGSGDKTVRVLTDYVTSQNGYITLLSNTTSSNVYVTRLNPTVEVVDMLTELGIPLTAEDLRQLILG